uniref:Mitochondrial assembly of ribosomal large subunit protein 1 n=1 Tax=Timema bartmani TaxID=61472 RepID=A0A7R9F288_9NEOP|nr:unnamed protein product [Timema bartmani]
MCSCVLRKHIVRNIFNMKKLQYTQLHSNSMNISICNRFYNDNSDDRLGKIANQVENKSVPGDVLSKYQVFRDEDSPIILDVEEERRKRLEQTESTLQEAVQDEFSGLNLQRGVNGVFDVEELVAILKRDKAGDVFVARLPEELKYVDHIVVVSGKSYRHMIGLAEFVRKAFKKKRSPNDIIPRIEGIKSKDWIALDLGNIALHIFSKSARSMFDLESLWSVGAQYDDLSNQPDDPLTELMYHHAKYLGDLTPRQTLG